MTETALMIKGLNKTYNGFKAVDNLDFEIYKDECFGFLGPNGAGKTTTMKVLYGKTEPDSYKECEINIFGFNPEKDSLSIKAMSGIVPQQDNLDAELNVTDNLMIYSKFYGIGKSFAMKRIEELLEFLELKEKAKAHIKELSGGMKRRLVIARALINNPKFLILDEPTTGLDPQVRHLIWSKLRELKKNGVTILITTHYMEEAFQICDRLIIMDKGKKILEGEPKKLLSENIEKNVMEVYGEWDEASILRISEKYETIRLEKHDDTSYLFCNEVGVLSTIGELLGGKGYYIRNSNLEDLFLKVTGRSINELQ